MAKIILISGKQGSGKTTLAKRIVTDLWAEGYKAVNFKFAGVLYQMHDAVRDVLKRYGLDELKGIDGQLLQVLGTEWGRNTRGHDIWVRCLQSAVRDYQIMTSDGFVVIDDCRFENEYRAFDDCLRVRLKAPVATRKLRAEKWRSEEHISETALDSFGDEWFDIVADTSLESVNSITRRIIGELLRQQGRPTITA
jgi:GTPase SAR1 family protein